MDEFAADLLVRLGRADEALAAATRAQDIVENSLLMKREHVTHLPQVADVDHALGIAKLAAEKFDQAVADLQLEVEARIRLDDYGAALASDRYELALALATLAEAQLALGKPSDAESTARLACDRGRKLVADAPEAKKYAVMLARAQVVLSEALDQNRKRDEASTVRAAALARLEPITRAFPTYLDAQQVFAPMQAKSASSETRAR